MDYRIICTSVIHLSMCGGYRMLLFILYLVISMFSVWLFKFVAATLEGFFLYVFFGLITTFKGDYSERMSLYPKRFLSSLLLKDICVGTLNFLMIYFVSYYFIYLFDGSYWLYTITSIIWSLFILNYASISKSVYFATSTLSLILVWLGIVGNLIPLLMIPVIFLIFMSSYFKKISTEDEQQVHA